MKKNIYEIYMRTKLLGWHLDFFIFLCPTRLRQLNFPNQIIPLSLKEFPPKPDTECFVFCCYINSSQSNSTKEVNGLLCRAPHDLHHKHFFRFVFKCSQCFISVDIMAKKTDYNAIKAKLKEFLTSFTRTDENGRKQFPYAEQITNIAHRLKNIRDLLTPL